MVSQRHTHPARHLTSRKLVVVLASAAVAGTATVAGASTIEHLGFAGASASVAPSCPGLPCEAITATTGFQASIAGTHDAMVIHHAGSVTTWSITLGAASADQIAFFDRVAHGPAQAGIVILRQGANYRYRVTGASPLIALNPYFGRTTSFTLTRPLAVAPGEVVALSVPTWAPALAIGLGTSTGWRASRASGACENLFTPSAQTAKGALTKYVCVYRTARITYGATVADTPTAPAKKPATGTPKAAPKKPAARSGAAAAPPIAAGASAHS